MPADRQPVKSKKKERERDTGQQANHRPVLQEYSWFSLWPGRACLHLNKRKHLSTVSLMLAVSIRCMFCVLWHELTVNSRVLYRCCHCDVGTVQITRCFSLCLWTRFEYRVVWNGGREKSPIPSQSRKLAGTVQECESSQAECSQAANTGQNFQGQTSPHGPPGENVGVTV